MNGKRRRESLSSRVPGWMRFLSYGGLVFGVAAPGAINCGVSDAALDECTETVDCQELPGTICNGYYCTCIEENDAFCLGSCRPIHECMGGESSSSSSSSVASGGGDGACMTAADCPQPGDPHCGTATCEGGVCGLTFKPFSELSSQIRGDCKDLWCDGDGNLIELDSPDAYNDGSQCTLDLCEADQPKNQPYSNGDVCPETGSGVCYESACVACVNPFANCPVGYSCDGVICVPMHCVNAQWDQGLGETSENCGGPCRPCKSGESCKLNKDCRDGVCSSGTCAPPTCSDKVKNNAETGIDCGGPPSCPRCPAGQTCKIGSDCESSVCWAGSCEPPKCDDGILNGDETAWDCGGSCGPCP
jgi:hypothetical protein